MEQMPFSSQLGLNPVFSLCIILLSLKTNKPNKKNYKTFFGVFYDPAFTHLFPWPSLPNPLGPQTPSPFDAEMQ